MAAGEPGSRLRDCAASADLSTVVVVLYDSSVSVLDMKEQQLRHTLQVDPQPHLLTVGCGADHALLAGTRLWADAVLDRQL